MLMSEDALDSVTQMEHFLYVVSEGNPLPLLGYHLKTVNGTFREWREREREREERRGEERGGENQSCDSCVD